MGQGFSWGFVGVELAGSGRFAGGFAAAWAVGPAPAFERLELLPRAVELPRLGPAGAVVPALPRCLSEPRSPMVTLRPKAPRSALRVPRFWSILTTRYSGE